MARLPHEQSFDEWVQRPDIVWHSSERDAYPSVNERGKERRGFLDNPALHVGTEAAARHRNDRMMARYIERGDADHKVNVYPLRIRTEVTGPIEEFKTGKDDSYENIGMLTFVNETGKPVRYQNAIEDEGSYSYVMPGTLLASYSQDLESSGNDELIKRAQEIRSNKGESIIQSLVPGKDSRLTVRERRFGDDRYRG